MTVDSKIKVQQVAEARFPCRFGEFRIFGFRGYSNGTETETVVLKMGDFSGPGPAPLVRIHSQCLTGDVFGSLRCDCGQQLAMALQQIAREGRGLLIYDPQEGRGIGLINKIKAYNLQDEGADTVEANHKLGFGEDLRDYGIGAQILTDIGVRKMRLITNNPRKIVGLAGYELEVVERVPLQMPASLENRKYLLAKKNKLGHLLDFGD